MHNFASVVFIIINFYMNTYNYLLFDNSTYMNICETANMHMFKSNVCTIADMKICVGFNSIFSGR
ncbi:MAG TPA: hypothetical protein DEF02_03415 [Clostridiales bacterium]|nr:hypothetical protein [Clostridiales bacterium]HBP51823.1 hypothetical protein [Clostridiales bacterium]HBW05618.1 hypothetical protein [Clostridiales bacterium]